MALTQAQLDHVMHQPLMQIIQLIQEGKISFPDDLQKYSRHPKFIAIKEQIDSLPDPNAMSQYQELKSLIQEHPEEPETHAKIASFISRYSAVKSLSPQVNELRELLAGLSASAEAEDWNRVDQSSVRSLSDHRRKYPATTHESEIDHAIWNLLDHGKESDIRSYMKLFPHGLHYSECEPMLREQELWNDVRRDADLVTLSDYIEEQWDSPFIYEAQQLFENLRRQELSNMVENPGRYDDETMRLLLDNSIVTEQMLIQAGAATAKSIEYIKNPPELAAIEQAVTSDPQQQDGVTDIFLFGIPSSGKTCVLTGLIGADEFWYDNSNIGGMYADDLKIYRDRGKAPQRTYGNFVAQIVGKIQPSEPGMPVFPVNFIEMSGEEFASKIAYNAENIVDFESMGTGASKILSNKNQKVIFIIIDPSADGLIRLAMERKSDGSTVTRTVQQDVVINKIINMLAKNENVLRHTNAIHFIMTKADTIGTPDVREEIAVERIRTLYSTAIARLKELGKKYSFNTTSSYSPKLYTFSLGHFYAGGYFEYDPTDSNIIINELKSMTQGERTRSFFDNFRS